MTSRGVATTAGLEVGATAAQLAGALPDVQCQANKYEVDCTIANDPLITYSFANNADVSPTEKLAVTDIPSKLAIQSIIWRPTTPLEMVLPP